MSQTAYREVLRKVERLTPADQLQLLEELVGLIRHQVTPRPRRSILELQGLGKKIWAGLDVQKYINQERASWNG